MYVLVAPRLQPPQTMLVDIVVLLVTIALLAQPHRWHARLGPTIPTMGKQNVEQLILDTLYQPTMRHLRVSVLLATIVVVQARHSSVKSLQAHWFYQGMALMHAQLVPLPWVLLAKPPQQAVSPVLPTTIVIPAV